MKSEELRAAKSREATEGTSVELEARGAHKNTPRKRKREKTYPVALKDTVVQMTEKQLEFMERLSENPGWEEYGLYGSYPSILYADEMSDTMDAKTVGAVMSTLQKKGLLTTETSRANGIRCCSFTLTELGVKVYKVLARMEVD